MFRAASERVESLHSHGRDRLGSEGELPLSAQPATTLIVATCADGRELRVANLGDSRAYVITADGQLIFASTPHNSLGGYVLKCLGDCRFEAPDVCSVRLPEDPAGVVVVCATDGVWAPLTGRGGEASFAEYLHRAALEVGGDSQQLAERLASDAVARAGTGADNATVSVVIL